MSYRIAIVTKVLLDDWTYRNKVAFTDAFNLTQKGRKEGKFYKGKYPVWLWDSYGMDGLWVFKSKKAYDEAIKKLIRLKSAGRLNYSVYAPVRGE